VVPRSGRRFAYARVRRRTITGTLRAIPGFGIAPVLQGIEAQAFVAGLRTYHDDILLLEHDGFVSRKRISPDDIERLLFEEVGFALKGTLHLNAGRAALRACVRLKMPPVCCSSRRRER
jgi:hypothetical protein